MTKELAIYMAIMMYYLHTNLSAFYLLAALCLALLLWTE